jgi:MFS family permease
MTDHSQPASDSHEHVRFNATVNILDGAFFGAGLGFASFTTVIPLFVSLLTNSPIIIGLAPAIHSLGWQLPQLPLSGRVGRLSRFKPTAMRMTLHERLPFLGLAVIAWFLPSLGFELALTLIFAMLVWQGFGGGFTANVWQSMIAKIIPETLHGRFFGIQMSALNLLMSGAAVAAGLILASFTSRIGFTLSFVLACVAMGISFFFLALTREVEQPPAIAPETGPSVWSETKRLLASDSIFRRFLVIRMIFQLGLVAFSFYAVYAVGERGVSVALVGVLTGVLMFCQMVANPLLGALGWTTTMVLSLRFGKPSDQSTYIGMSNTLIAPVTLAAPFLAGLIINAFGYPAMFKASALVFLAAAVVSLSMLRLKPSPLS